MSYLTHVPNPPRREVCKRCCKICGSSIKANLINSLEVHKSEVAVVFSLFSWIVINTVLFAIAVNQTDPACAPKKIWLWFGGLTFCLPTTLLLGFGIVCLWIYLWRIYGVAMDATQRELNPNVYESWVLEKSIHLDEQFGPDFEKNADGEDVIIRTL